MKEQDLDRGNELKRLIAGIQAELQKWQRDWVKKEYNPAFGKSSLLTIAEYQQIRTGVLNLLASKISDATTEFHNL